MAAICRLAGRRILNNYVSQANTNFLAVRAVQMNVVPKPVTDIKISEHDAHNKQLGRPMSPWMNYAPQYTWVLSITHRITGCMLSGYFYLFALGPPLWTNYSAVLAAAPLSPALQVLLKMLIAFPFSFHVANGIRHLVWDSGRSLELKDVYTGAYTVLGLTAAFTIGASML